jgi:hypothetical protein
MIEDYVDDFPKLSEVENAILTTDFTKKKVFVAISQIEHNKAHIGWISC